MTHALLSASGAERWMACTPSARLEEQMPDSPSVYAEEGTLAHELAEAVNRYNFNDNTDKAKEKLNLKLAEIVSNPLFNAEMEEYIDGFARYVQEKYNEAKAISNDAVIAFEERLDFSDYVPEGFGTGDVIIITDGKLTVIDLKYGKGVLVEAENNKQMMLYALGALNAYDLFYGIESVNMVVYQPRRDNISEWDVPTVELLDWAKSELKEKADLAYDGAGDFVPGEYCRFCRAGATCRARAEENINMDFHAELRTLIF